MSLSILLKTDRPVGPSAAAALPHSKDLCFRSVEDDAPNRIYSKRKLDFTEVYTNCWQHATILVTGYSPFIVEWSNKIFAEAAGWSSEEIVGLDLRFLGGDDAFGIGTKELSDVIDIEEPRTIDCFIGYDKYGSKFSAYVECVPIWRYDAQAQSNILSSIAIIFKDPRPIGKDMTIASAESTFLFCREEEVGLPLDRRDYSDCYRLAATTGVPRSIAASINELISLTVDDNYTVGDILRYTSMIPSLAPIAITDRKGHIISTNDAFSLLFGVRSNDVEGRTFDFLFGAETDNESKQIFPRYDTPTFGFGKARPVTEFSAVLYDFFRRPLSCSVKTVPLFASSWLSVYIDNMFGRGPAVSCAGDGGSGSSSSNDGYYFLVTFLPLGYIIGGPTRLPTPAYTETPAPRSPRCASPFGNKIPGTSKSPAVAVVSSDAASSAGAASDDASVGAVGVSVCLSTALPATSHVAAKDDPILNKVINCESTLMALSLSPPNSAPTSLLPSQAPSSSGGQLPQPAQSVLQLQLPTTPTSLEGVFHYKAADLSLLGWNGKGLANGGSSSDSYSTIGSYYPSVRSSGSRRSNDSLLEEAQLVLSESASDFGDGEEHPGMDSNNASGFFVADWEDDPRDFSH